MWLLDIAEKYGKKELQVVKKAPFVTIAASLMLSIIWVIAFHISMAAVIGMQKDLTDAYEKENIRLKAKYEPQAMTGDEKKKHEASKDGPMLNLKVVERKKFANQEVPLDGYSYYDCVFDNVTFLFNGEPSQLINVKVLNYARVKTFDDRVRGTFTLLKSLKILRPDASFEIQDKP